MHLSIEIVTYQHGYKFKCELQKTQMVKKKKKNVNVQGQKIFFAFFVLVSALLILTAPHFSQL